MPLHRGTPNAGILVRAALSAIDEERPENPAKS
jgi:hypothetical protein